MTHAPAAGTHPTSIGYVVANAIAFQIGWFACVLGAAYGLAAAGSALAAVIVALHLVFAARPAQSLKLIAIALLLGGLWDSALMAARALEFTSGGPMRGAAPHWILALWALFATTLNVSLGWLHGRALLAALVGAVAGPLSYWGAAQLGAVTLIDPVFALTALAVGWAAIMPALMALARRYDGIHPHVAG